MSRLAMFGGPSDRQRFKRVVWQSNENMICTLTRLLEVCATNQAVLFPLLCDLHLRFRLQSLINPYPDLSDAEIERFFIFACVWAFGGTLESIYREQFSNWWKRTFVSRAEFDESSGCVSDVIVTLSNFLQLLT